MENEQVSLYTLWKHKNLSTFCVREPKLTRLLVQSDIIGSKQFLGGLVSSPYDAMHLDKIVHRNGLTSVQNQYHKGLIWILDTEYLIHYQVL